MGDPAVVKTGAGTSGRGNQPIVYPAINNAPTAAQLVQQILKNTNVTLKQEVIKLPELFGQARKDTISALDFISRIDECQVSNDWNNVTTYANFCLCLRGEAEKWVASKACYLELTSKRNLPPFQMTN
jgi:hypothetical protein